nr:EOG090X05JJ [Ilyocryptus agilis]
MRTITEAVREKYQDDDDEEDTATSGIILFVPRSSPRQQMPCTLILDHCDISSVGDVECLGSMCSQVKELDLAHNHLSSWDEVHKLVNYLPKLSFLNLSYNMLGGNVKIPTVSYPSLKKLVLNRVGEMQWSKLVPYLSLLPNLEELHLSFNQMTVPEEVDITADVAFPKVKTLHLDGNRIQHRDHLRWISFHFPSVASLVLCDCPLWTLRRKPSSATREIEEFRNISDGYSSGSLSGSGESSSTATCIGDGKNSSCCQVLTADDDETKKLSGDPLFPFLRSFSLNNSLIDCWEDVNHLRSFPSLVELRMQSCPLFRLIYFCDTKKLTEHERRQLTIARLPNLRRLNGGSDITAKEREESERNFIRRFNDCEVKPERYEELVNIHGHVAPFAEVSLTPPKFANVWVRYGEQRWNEKRLSLQLTMKEVKERFSFVIGMPSSKLRLWHYDESMMPMEMRFPSKKMYSYNIKDGDEFMIDEKL